MSHYHLEIVMPPTDDVEAAVGKILEPFYEGNEEAAYPFWDWWVIGGRFSGNKLRALLGEARMDAFSEKLTAEGITVSSLRCGKPTLQPAEQAAKVDALWNEAFPDSPVKQCPMFDNYKGTFGDVMRYDQTPANLTASHIIFANKKREAVFMPQRIDDTEWDGTLSRAVTLLGEKVLVKPDWLVVTVDYHN